jgi:hypothetical protein
VKKLPLFALILSAALAAPAFADDTAAKPAKAPTAQQQRMKDCNAEAKTKNLAGDERKTFMKSCLKGESAAADGASDKQKAQREKMKTCNADAKAKNLMGDERKKFMKSCLSS